jgi:hypothetical protein
MRGLAQQCVVARAKGVSLMNKSAQSEKFKGLTPDKFRKSCNIIHISKQKAF